MDLLARDLPAPTLAEQDPELAAAIAGEEHRQRVNLELIASENYASRAVREAMGSVLTNKHAEGYPGKRYYGGCEFVDVAEQLAIDRARKWGNAAVGSFWTTSEAPPRDDDPPLSEIVS